MNHDDSATPVRLLGAAFRVFAARGYAHASMADVAREAQVDLHVLHAHFPGKVALAHAGYVNLLVTLAGSMPDMPEGDLVSRFTWLVDRKLALLDHRRPQMLALAAAALDPDGPLGVLSPATMAIRARTMGLIRAALAGASDPPAELDRTMRVAYGLHLLAVLLWTQDPTAARAALPGLGLALSAMPLAAWLPGVAGPLAEVEGAMAARLPHVDADADELANAILRRLMHGRRLMPGTAAASQEAAFAPHLPLVLASLVERRPLRLALPAFPARSPNPRKTLGPLPDLGERTALVGLQALCDALPHPHGVELWVCSDGSVFADAVGVTDDDVTAYGAAIDGMIADLPSIRRFDLRDVYAGNDPAEARTALLSEWAETTATLAAAAAHGALRRQLDGLHRFVFEDMVVLHPDLSRTQARKRAEGAALEVLRRSRAWGRLVGAQFPDAVRLSIHPQPQVSDKIGVHLLPTDDVWLTPWHGAALLDGERVQLVKRADAEASGAVVVHVDGRPSHLLCNH